MNDDHMKADRDCLSRLEEDIRTWCEKDATRPLPSLMSDVEGIVLAHKFLQIRCDELEAEVLRLSSMTKYE